jgi:hypothetical protein
MFITKYMYFSMAGPIGACSVLSEFRGAKTFSGFARNERVKNDCSGHEGRGRRIAARSSVESWVSL